MGRNASTGVMFFPISLGFVLHSLNNWKQLTPEGLHILVKNSCSNPYVKNKLVMTNVCHNRGACQNWWPHVQHFSISTQCSCALSDQNLNPGLSHFTSFPLFNCTMSKKKKKHVRYAAAVGNHKSRSRSRQVVLGEVEGFRGTGALQDQLTANTEWDYLNVKQAISLTTESAEVNKLMPYRKWCDC